LLDLAFYFFHAAHADILTQSEHERHGELGQPGPPDPVRCADRTPPDRDQAY
jgi:hypothetical protein